MIRALIIRRRGIKTPHLGLSLFIFLAAAALEEALNIPDQDGSSMAGAEPGLAGGRTDTPTGDFFFSLGLILVFSTSQMNLQRTGIHPPRALRSHLVFKAASKIIQKSICLPPFWQRPCFFTPSYPAFVAFT